MFLRRFNKLISNTVSRSFYRSAVRLNDEPPAKEISGSVATKFQVFRNETGIIFDIEEERRRQDENDFYEEKETFTSPYEGINLERGVTGVFEIKDLVEVLRKENARNLCVIKLPKDLQYVDYFCIVNGISYRHMIGMAQFVRKCYKMKRQSGDVIPRIEGELSKDWICMDLGNIALHIFTKDSREYYDLESLWCLGEDYEKRIKNKDKTKELYASYLQAASSPIGSIPLKTEDEKETSSLDR